MKKMNLKIELCQALAEVLNENFTIENQHGSEDFLVDAIARCLYNELVGYLIVKTEDVYR